MSVSADAAPDLAAARVRRAYATWDSQQVHYRYAGSNAAGSVPVVLLHQAFHSGAVFGATMAALAATRRVIAPDLPGHGESDATSEPSSIDDFVAAATAVLDTEQAASVDVVGYHLGCVVAVELALRYPTRIRRLVLIGVPCLTDEERAQGASMLDARRSDPTEDGSHLTAEWDRSIRWRGNGMTVAMIARNFLDKLKAGTRLTWGARAALQYPLFEQLQKVQQPISTVRARDDLWEVTPRAGKVIPNLTAEHDVEAFGFGVFEVAPALMSKIIAGDLDRPLVALASSPSGQS